MNKLNKYLAEIEKTSVAVYLACEDSVAKDISGKLSKTAAMLKIAYNGLNDLSVVDKSIYPALPERRRALRFCADEAKRTIAQIEAMLEE